jgi:hypothetical protein
VVFEMENFDGTISKPYCILSAGAFRSTFMPAVSLFSCRVVAIIDREQRRRDRPAGTSQPGPSLFALTHHNSASRQSIVLSRGPVLFG